MESSPIQNVAEKKLGDKKRRRARKNLKIFKMQ